MLDRFPRGYYCVRAKTRKAVCLGCYSRSGGYRASCRTTLENADLWNARLGHVAPTRMNGIASTAIGVPKFPKEYLDNGPCEGCVYGTMTVSPFARKSGSTVKTGNLLEIVHSDMMGLVHPPSIGKHGMWCLYR